MQHKTSRSARSGWIVAVVGVLAAFVLAMANALAAGTPDIGLSVDAPARVLFGTEATVVLTAQNSSGTTGYNLSFQEVLPAGVSYVAGSAAIAPRILSNAPTTGSTTLIWDNVADLAPGSSHALSHRLAHRQSVFSVGDNYALTAGAYINGDPRMVPDFDAVTGAPVGPGASSYTGYATGNATTSITAVRLDKTEPSVEGELLRGVHDHPTTYTLTVHNNAVNPTGDLIVDDYLPAGLEFLGCGGVDHTTDAPTNPGSAEEYAGSGALGVGVASPADCRTPALVETVQTDPDGSGSMPNAVYTHLRWTGLGVMGPSGSVRIQYVAGIPIRANTLDWNGATAGLGTAPGTGGAQGANLNNNSGAEAVDEGALTNLGLVSGIYNGTLAVQDDEQHTVTAEDLAVHKSVGNGAINQGDIETWSLTVRTSEYRVVDSVAVTDTLPDGLCPLSGTNLEGTAECAPTGDLPSHDYTSALENADGTWTLIWDSSTVPELVRLQPSETLTITFPTRTRGHYQENGADDAPVLSRDSWQNTVSITGADSAICAPNDPDCNLGGARIAADEADGTADTDTSSAGQSAAEPTLDKKVAQAPGTDCATATYIDGPAQWYGPGDRVCWKLRATFPGALDSGTVTITDFIPPGTTYVAGSVQTTPDNTLSVATDDSGAADGTLAWNVGTVASGSQVFEVTFATLVGNPASTTSFDIRSNLMKMSFANSGGQTFPLRDQADFEWAEPQLSLLKGVRSVDGAPAAGNPANTDGATVTGGSVVTYRIDIDNAGARDASAIEVWDPLPTGFTCAQVSAVSNGGSCNAGAGRIEWSGLSVNGIAASGDPAVRLTLTYDLTMPAQVAPEQRFDNTAGIRQYRSPDNQGGSTVMIPSGNIDPDAGTALGAANAAAASDSSHVLAQAATLTKTRTTGITATGNTAADQATIGEAIAYTVTFTVPKGTTITGSPTVTDALGTRQTYVTGSADAKLNGGALPGGVTLTDTGNTVTLAFPASYTAPAGADAVFTITFSARVDDDTPGNARIGTTPSTLPNTADAAWTTPAGADSLSATVNTTIVEPNLAVTKTENDADDRVIPGQTVRYTVTATNTSGTRVSPAYDLVVTDTLPAGLTPVDGTGTPVVNLGSVPLDGGVWNSATRTITWAVTTLNPGASSQFRYDVKVDDPLVAADSLTNTATVTGTSLPDPQDDTGERSSASAGTPPGYAATTNHTVQVADPTVDKTVNPTGATVGQTATYTLVVTVPAGLSMPDATVIDQVPDGIDVIGTSSATCTAGCPPAITVATLPATANADGSTTLGWFLGDVAAGGTARTVRIVYTARVDDRYEPEATSVSNGNTLTNSARVHWNLTDTLGGTPGSIPAANTFAAASVADTATVTVIEPTLTIDKDVSGDPDDDDLRDVQPGDHLTYTLRITNTGTAPAYDVPVTDQPDAELVNVSAATGVSDLTDGWTAGDPDMAWTIPGPIAAGDTVLLTYTADLAASSGLTDGQFVDNTGAIGTYYGLPSADRGGIDTRAYSGVTPDTVRLTVDLPSITVEKTTGGTGFPDSANAEVGQSFPWRVVVRNTAATATAYGVDVTVVLPPNWTYVAGSATRAPGGAAEPTVTTQAGGDRLVWTDAGDIAPGGALTITFNARPGQAAATTPGVGAGHPHTNTARAAASDGSGATGSAGGAYATGDDTAQAILLLPTMTLAKTPDGDAAVAGTTSQFQVLVRNTGTGTARGVRVTDTLPTGLTYTAGTATATGLTEESVTTGSSGTTVVWTLPNLAAGASTTILLPVHVDAPQPDGTVRTNQASVAVNELPGTVQDTGSLVVDSAPVWSAASGKTASPASGTQVRPAETITYTVHYANTGNEDATGVTVTDPIPAHTTFVPGSATSTPAVAVEYLVGGAYRSSPPADPTLVQGLRFRPGTVAMNASGDVGFRVRVDTPLPDTTVITNTADIDSDQNSYVVGPVTHTVDSAPILELRKSADRERLVVNDDGPLVRYTLRVTNSGDANATSVTITDGPPAHSTLDAIEAGTATVTCAVETVAPYTFGACPTNLASVTRVRWSFAQVTTAVPQQVGMTVRVPRPTTQPLTLTNTSDLTSTELGAGVSNTVNVPVVAAPRLALTKAVSPTGDAAPGTVLTYAMTLTNTGSRTAANVTLDDPIPANSTYVAGSADAGARFLVDGAYTDAEPADPSRVQGLRWEAASLAVDAQVSHGFAVRLADVLAPDTRIRNTATADADTLEPVTASTETRVASSPVLTLEKDTVVLRVNVGQLVTYTITARAEGDANAEDVVVRDRMPRELAFVSASDGGVHSAGVVRWSLGGLAVGQERVVSVVARVLPGASGRARIQNMASATTSTPVEAPPLNAAAEVSPARNSATLALTKRGPARTVGGRTGRWTIVVRNTGRFAARNTTVVDRLPNGFAVVRSSVRYRLRGGALRWSLGTLPAGRRRVIHVTLRAARNVHGRRTNLAVAVASNAAQATAAATTRARRGSPVRSPAITG